MTLERLVSYVGLALVYAICVTAVALVAARAVGRRPGAALVCLGLSVFFVIFLGLHPFPDPAVLNCSEGGRPLLLKPFGYMEEARRLWRKGVPLASWAGNLTIAPAVMNFVIFAGIGAIAARVLPGLGAAFLLGAGVSGFIEIAQLTALFGLYPCPYRYFEVDDLILNVSGVVAGFALLRNCGWRPARAAP